MSENLQAMLKRAFLNNSFDYDSMDKEINKAWTNSYSYLYTLQKSHVDYEELFYYSGDVISRDETKAGRLYLNKSLYACFDIDHDLIHACNREEYRRSRFYYRPYSFLEMIENVSVFHRIPIVMIDDQLIFDYKLISMKDSTTFILPFKRDFVIENPRNTETDDIVYIDHKIQVLVVDNEFYERLLVNKNTINFSAINSTIEIPKSLFTEDLPKGDGVMFASIHIPTAKVGGKFRGYELGTMMIPLTDTGESYTATLTEEIRNKMHSYSGEFYLSTVYVNELYPHEFYFGGNEVEVDANGKTSLMVVQEEELVPYKTPIPVEDFMIFKKDHDSTEYKLVQNVKILELHYPNIYTFIDDYAEPGDRYRIYYFYHNIDVLKYTVLFDFYYRFLFDVFENYTSLEAILDSIYNDKLDYHTLDYFTEENQRRIRPDGIKCEIVVDIETGEEYQLGGLSVLPMNVKPEEFHPQVIDSDIAGPDGEVVTYELNLTKDSSIRTILDVKDGEDRYSTGDIGFIKAKPIRNKDMFFSEAIREFRDLFDDIINYEYYEHLYGEHDFLNRYIMIEGNEDKAPFEYKDETLRAWMKVEPHLLRDYVLEQKKLGDIFHLFTNTIDLSTRERMDTYTEMGRVTHTFSEPHYVFAFSNTKPYDALLDCRVFVDGLFVIELYQERKAFMDYLYIPKRLVTEDSYIEVEIFPTYMYKEDMTFESLDDVKTVNLPKAEEVIFPTLADIYFTSKDYPDVRFDEENFLFVLHCEDKYGDRGDFPCETTEEDKPVEFIRLNDTFTIKPKNNRVVGIPLEMRFSKDSLRLQVQITDAGYPHFKFAEKNWMFSTEYIRIFRNGRLVPRCKYQFNSSYGQPRLILLDYYEVGETIMIDIAPYRYHEIYYQEELTDLVIDLRKIINKPFDPRYYDIYLNGRRLSLNNVFSITPWQITLVNIHTIYNLEIFEKERDWEYFGLDYTKHMYFYTIDDLFNSGFITEEEKGKLIRRIIDRDKDENLNIYPNTNDEEKMDRTDLRKFVQFYIYYHDELIPKEFYNPDVLEENYELMSEDYFYILETYMRRSRDYARNREEYERKYYYPKVIDHDPDLVVGNGNPNNMYVVCPIGHLEDELPDEYKDQVPKFINDSDLDTYTGI